MLPGSDRNILNNWADRIVFSLIWFTCRFEVLPMSRVSPDEISEIDYLLALGYGGGMEINERNVVTIKKINENDEQAPMVRTIPRSSHKVKWCVFTSPLKTTMRLVQQNCHD